MENAPLAILNNMGTVTDWMIKFFPRFYLTFVVGLQMAVFLFSIFMLAQIENAGWGVIGIGYVTLFANITAGAIGILLWFFLRKSMRLWWLLISSLLFITAVVPIFMEYQLSKPIAPWVNNFLETQALNQQTKYKDLEVYRVKRAAEDYPKLQEEFKSPQLVTAIHMDHLIPIIEIRSRDNTIKELFLKNIDNYVSYIEHSTYDEYEAAFQSLMAFLKNKILGHEIMVKLPSYESFSETYGKSDSPAFDAGIDQPKGSDYLRIPIETMIFQDIDLLKDKTF